MSISKCPGQDRKFWKPEDIFEVFCPKCGNEVEFFKDDIYQTCSICGLKFRNPKIDLGCAKWCKFAKQCLGNIESIEDFKTNSNEYIKGEYKMNKIKRNIISINEEKCDGCGLCIPSCPEQAIQIVNGKAKLVKDLYCDGLGACLLSCPNDALKIEEREVEPYNDEATIKRIKEVAPEMLETHIKHIKEHSEGRKHQDITACPGSQMMSWKSTVSETVSNKPSVSQLSQWPIQLHLVSPNAPYFKNSDLAIVADCVPFAYANFHQDFLSGKAITIACPKLDDIEPYAPKLSEIISQQNLKSLEVIHMEVPCCFGLMKIVQEALSSSGVKIPIKETVISIKGEKK